jgi:hypothetical protein
MGPRSAAMDQRRPVAVHPRPPAEQLGQHEATRARPCLAHVLSTVHALTPGAP